MLLLRRLRQALRRQLLILMARRPALLCGAVLLGVLMVLAVKFTCGRAKNVVAPARPPVRFFSPEAPVLDLYLGQIDQCGGSSDCGQWRGGQKEPVDLWDDD